MVRSSADANGEGRDEPMTDAIVRRLSEPEAYEERPSAVKVVETHISWVFLTEQYAFKLKKPVRFEFVDFRPLSRRHEACRDEVTLNRRLAPDVYLDVVPVRRAVDGRLSLDGTGSVVDWVVKMRRLPDERSLEALLRNNTLTRQEIQALSATLTGFYRRLSPLKISADEYCTRLMNHVRANQQALEDHGDRVPQTLVQRAHSGQLRVLCLRPELIGGRAADGRIVEGHGDLRPDHIYFVPRPTVIDCVEFSRELRQLDVLDELSFLAMECDYRERSDIGREIIERYLQASGDSPAPPLIAFYKSYRASVHAKVATLRADQHGDSVRSANRGTAERYLQLAAEYASELGPPLLMLMHGLAGTGKSTVASEIADRLNLHWLRTDTIRRQMFPAETATGGDPRDRYRDENRDRVYDEMLQRAEASLSLGLSVILDGTFLAAKHIQAAIDVGLRRSAFVCVVDCRCSERAALDRIGTRLENGDFVSEATPRLHQQQRIWAEPIPEAIAVCPLDTEQPVASTVESLLRFLRGHVLPQSS
ncbi:MAG: AAA family ATPase [Planctomycetes bacterium]|nr:AAA family ATPase [Planctomycetota bacterium]